MDEIVWRHFWLIFKVARVPFSVYCCVREFIRVIGKREFAIMFWGQRWVGHFRKS